MKTAHQKGRDLEEAVYFIQKSILETDPKYRGQKFTIGRNEHFNVDGVRHEVDVLVRVNPETDYEAMLLFECKNWSTTVGKNEVIVLSEKIEALSAARGFLVGKSFSADAEAQARKDPRIKLVECTSELQRAFSIQLLHKRTDLLTIQVSARVVAPDKSPSAGTLSHRDIWTFEGRPLTLGAVIRQHADHFYDEHFKREHARLQLEGTHHGTASGRLEFELGELTFGDQTMEWMEMVCAYQVTNSPRKIRSQFDLRGYGRTYSFEPIEADGKALEVTIVIRSNL